MTFLALIELRRAGRVKGFVPRGIHEVGHLEAIDAEAVLFAGIGDLEAIETEARSLDAVAVAPPRSEARNRPSLRPDCSAVNLTAEPLGTPAEVAFGDLTCLRRGAPEYPTPNVTRLPLPRPTDARAACLQWFVGETHRAASAPR